MDSLTQLVLGASVAGSIGIKPFGRKVLLVGAALGTLPDLDVLVQYQTAIDSFTLHRSASHSLFVLSAVSVLLYCLTLWLKPNLRRHKPAVFAVIYLPLITHPLLDAFTTYGTQLWWPIDIPPTAWSSIFIIDPTYTLPLLVAVVALWRYQHSHKWQKINRILLSISCLYLMLGVGQREYLQQQLAHDPMTQNSRIFISPTPFNIVVWRVLSYHDEGYDEAFTSVFNDQPLHWKAHDTGRALIAHFNSDELQRLTWFSDGLLKFEEQQETLIATDLRLGFAQVYPFSFRLATRNKSKPTYEQQQEAEWISIPSQKMPMQPVTWEKIKSLLPYTNCIK